MYHLHTQKSAVFALFIILLSLTSCAYLPNHQSTTASKSSPENTTRHTITAVSSIKQKALTTKDQTLWQRLITQYQFPDVHNERIQKEIDWYTKHPEFFQRIQKNAEPYLHFVIEQVEAKQLPGEFALLPIVESSYRPFAYSHGRAAGLWQFIPSTGNHFGLEQNWWYDGRRDVYLSTQAALKYLDQLAKRFDQDWFLALAGYNAGGGTISSAIRKNKRQQKPTDYWSLSLRNETMRYVPKLIALAKIFAQPEQYGVTLIDIPNKPYFERVLIGQPIDLARASELAEIDLDELYKLNPAFNQWATAPNGPHHLLLPTHSVDMFKQRLAELPDDQRMKWARHQIKKGETLGQIARQYRTTIEQIKTANHMRTANIREGRHLLIPTAHYKEHLYAHSKEARHKRIVETQRRGFKVEHRVKRGESLWSLSQQYQVGVRKLASDNAMAPGDTLRVGQNLIIWSKKPSHSILAEQKRLQTIRYTVKQGDSLSRISKKFKVTVADLQRWNPSDKKYLKPGQQLKIIVDITRS